MIARITKGRGFSGCVGYIASGRQGEKIGHSFKIAGSVAGETPAEIAAEMRAVAAMNGRLERAVWHGSLSFGQDQLDEQTLARIAEDFLTRMGADPENHQWACWKHTDSDHLHIHIVVNRQGLDGQVWEDSRDFKRAMQVCRELEQEYGLRADIPRNLEKSPTIGEQAAEKRGAPTGRRRVQFACKEAREEAGTFDEYVKALKKAGVEVEVLSNAGGPYGIRYGLQGQWYKGSQIGKGYTLKALREQGLEPEITHAGPQIHSQTLKDDRGNISGLTSTTYGSSRADLEDAHSMAFAIGKDFGSIEALKAGGLEPARVVLGDDRSLVVVFKTDRPMHPRDREALAGVVRGVVAEATPCPTLPEGGLVLEAKESTLHSHVLEKGRGPDKGLER